MSAQHRATTNANAKTLERNLFNQCTSSEVEVPSKQCVPHYVVEDYDDSITVPLGHGTVVKVPKVYRAQADVGEGSTNAHFAPASIWQLLHCAPARSRIIASCSQEQLALLQQTYQLSPMAGTEGHYSQLFVMVRNHTVEKGAAKIQNSAAFTAVDSDM